MQFSPLSRHLIALCSLFTCFGLYGHHELLKFVDGNCCSVVFVAFFFLHFARKCL
jgi:hypothetical protein